MPVNKDYGLVSIVMPSYNTEKYIAESIQSVLEQTYSNWELLVVDDCSTDGTDDVIAQFDDIRIRYFKFETNAGVAAARNKALCEAKGEWVAFLDSDDVWSPCKLEHQLEFMECRGASASYSSYVRIDQDGNSLGLLLTGPKHVGKKLMSLYCWPGCLTVMFRRMDVSSILLGNVRKHNDYALWLKVCSFWDFYYYPEPLGKYRVRTKSISHGNGYIKQIEHFYALWRKEFGCCRPSAFIHTALNLVFGCVKKVLYEKGI